MAPQVGSLAQKVMLALISLGIVIFIVRGWGDLLICAYVMFPGNSFFSKADDINILLQVT